MCNLPPKLTNSSLVHSCSTIQKKHGIKPDEALEEKTNEIHTLKILEREGRRSLETTSSTNIYHLVCRFDKNEYRDPWPRDDQEDYQKVRLMLRENKMQQSVLCVKRKEVEL